jgi:predicted ABC-type transport system involved in lysophospholipase L1 biosynthesis ATPase subunit
LNWPRRHCAASASANASRPPSQACPAANSSGIRNPRLILADEPTGSLDPVTAGQVMDLLFETAREDGRALILVTHDHALARRADHVYTLDAGKLTSAD